MPTLIPSQTSVETANRIVLKDITCDVSIAVGDWVRFNASSEAVLSQANSSTNAKLQGVVESKTTTTTCNVLISGVSKPIFAGLDQTKEYFLSPSSAGDIQDTQPTGSGEVIVSAGQPIGSTRFYVKVIIRTILS